MFCKKRCYVLLAALSVLSIPWTLQSNELVKNDRISILHLTNGDHVTGTLVPANSEECLGWQSPLFVSPFQFSMGGLASVHFSAPAVLPTPEGSYSFEIAGGDLLFGSLVELNAETATLEIPGVGRVVADRAIVQRIYRRGGGNDLLFIGPSGLVGWQTSGEADAWREDAGHLLSDKAGAVLRRDFAMPNQVRIEFELSWTGRPDFELAVAVDENSKTVSRAFRFDVWDDELVIQRETDVVADVVSLLKGLKAEPGRIHVQAFLDQALGRMLVYSSAGDKLADLTVAGAKPGVEVPVYGGLQLTNRRGDIRLERLQISRWNGEIPRSVELDKSRIHGVDGSITYGAVKSYDPSKHEFVVGEDANLQTIPEDRIQDVFLSQAGEGAPRSIRAVYLTGMKIGGEIVAVEGQKVRLKSPGFQEPFEIAMADLQSLVVVKPQSEVPRLPQREGRLEIAGATIRGCLVDGKDGSASCLVWQPLYSLTAAALQKGVSARIVYFEPPKPVAPKNPQQAQPPNAVPRRLINKVKESKPDGAGGSEKSADSILHLRTGDTVPCEVVSVDEQGLTFKSPISGVTFVPHAQIHALELMPDIDSADIDMKKTERLLTLPRMQRDSPPTHLIRSIDADYLRGRLIGINDAQIQVELRLEGRMVRRDRVARIIWLHPESMANAKPDAKAAEPPAFDTTNLVQALHSSTDSPRKRAASLRKRLTFRPEDVEGSTLSGRSELFGVCHLDLTKVDELLVGAAIEKSTGDLPFGRWKLKPALEPLAPKEEGSSDGAEGQESPLVGKAAPDISQKLLEGGKFVLKDHKQKVVVLDFWASWCGPCMQVMPQIHKVADEFADQGVELFAINLEETPEKIKAALEKLKLSMPVVLDRDGRIAERYGATAIPQTVVIDRDGKVARLFVGGGARFDEHLRAALKAVLAGDAPKDDAPKGDAAKADDAAKEEKKEQK